MKPNEGPVVTDVASRFSLRVEQVEASSSA